MFRHGLTYSGHATACVVAEANLDIVEREGLVARAGELEGVLARALAPLRDHALVEDVRTGSGFMAGVQLRPEVSADKIAIACTEAGVLMRLIHNNTLHISPPFVVTDDEVALMATTILGVGRSLMTRVGNLFGPDFTFLGVPAADLSEPSTYSDADVVIIGAPFDGGTSYRSGARFGPQAIRSFTPTRRLAPHWRFAPTRSKTWKMVRCR